MTNSSLLVRLFALYAAVLCSVPANAELSDLTDGELSAVAGAGVGLVLEDFVFEHHNDDASGQIFKIGGIKSTSGEDVEISVGQLYIARSGSNYGNTLDPVNLGRLINPYTIDVIDGDAVGVGGKAVLQFAAPTKVPVAQGYDCLSASAAVGSGTCSSRPSSAAFLNGERPDMGMRMEVAVGAKSVHNLNIHAKSAVMDGSFLRLWGDDDRRQLVAEIQLNFYTPELSVNACDAAGQNCGSPIYMRNFELELSLGNNLQPMYIDVNGAGNFVFEIKKIRQPLPGEIAADGSQASSDVAAWNFYEDYYTNSDYRSNLRIGELQVNDHNFGSARVEGMIIQHLKITSHDLAP